MNPLYHSRYMSVVMTIVRTQLPAFGALNFLMPQLSAAAYAQHLRTVCVCDCLSTYSVEFEMSKVCQKRIHQNQNCIDPEIMER